MTSRKRLVRVYVREIIIITKKFKIMLLVFATSMVLATSMLMMRQGLSFLRALYESIAIMFLSSTLPYPENDLVLEVMWIAYPLIAVTLIAEGMARLGESLKLRDITSEEWNLSMAKELENHVIIIGLGNVGLRVIEHLAANTDLEFVGIDPLKTPDSDIKREYQEKYKFPLITGRGERRSSLKKANVDKARAILCLIDDDLLNVKIALLAKKMNKNIITVVRMFDVEFGELIKESFDIDHVVSTTKIAAPRFVDLLTRSSSS